MTKTKKTIISLCGAALPISVFSIAIQRSSSNGNNQIINPNIALEDNVPFHQKDVPVTGEYFKIINGYIEGFSTRVESDPSLLNDFNTLNLSFQKINGQHCRFKPEVFNVFLVRKIDLSYTC
jgi:hypothetical protein